jgi:DNA-binding CsgD family transcriptional regulator
LIASIATLALKDALNFLLGVFILTGLNYNLISCPIFGEYYIHPNFVKKLSTYPKEQLSPAELRLGMLLRLNLNSKEIAAVLRVSPDSIRVARHRLRKKLGIEQKEELVHFLLGL